MYVYIIYPINLIYLSIVSILSIFATLSMFCLSWSYLISCHSTLSHPILLHNISTQYSTICTVHTYVYIYYIYTYHIYIYVYIHIHISISIYLYIYLSLYFYIDLSISISTSTSTYHIYLHMLRMLSTSFRPRSRSQAEEDLEGELDAIAEEDLQLGPAPLFHWECFHSHGGTPIAGWFKNWKILLKIRMIWVYPHFRKPPNRMK